jgi:hypothetical protein
MVREVRRPFLRVGVVGLWVAMALAPASCAKIWGIDDGIPFPDASTTDVAAGQDVSMQDVVVDAASEAASDGGEDASDASDAAEASNALDASEAGDASDAGETTDAGDAEVEACSPILSWCLDHCGTGPNNCSQSTICGNICGTGDGVFCDASTNQCDCTRDPTWCSGRCGAIADNCGRADDCGACAPDACVPASNPCGTLACGTATDTCGNIVNCGSGGTTQCSGDGLCDAGSCCQPNQNACQGFCNSAPNGCGGMTGCSSLCPGGESCNAGNNTCFCPPPTCNGIACGTIANTCGNVTTCGCSNGQTCDPQTNQCCTPNGTCNGCNNNCGVPSTLCCSDAGGPDGGPDGGPEAGGPDGGDGGSCLPSGAVCVSSTDCCSDVCGPSSIIGGGPDGAVGPLVCQ